MNEEISSFAETDLGPWNPPDSPGRVLRQFFGEAPSEELARTCVKAPQYQLDVLADVISGESGLNSNYLMLRNAMWHQFGLEHFLGDLPDDDSRGTVVQATFATPAVNEGHGRSGAWWLTPGAVNEVKKASLLAQRVVVADPLVDWAKSGGLRSHLPAVIQMLAELEKLGPGKVAFRSLSQMAAPIWETPAWHPDWVSHILETGWAEPEFDGVRLGDPEAADAFRYGSDRFDAIMGSQDYKQSVAHRTVGSWEYVSQAEAFAAFDILCIAHGQGVTISGGLSDRFYLGERKGPDEMIETRPSEVALLKLPRTLDMTFSDIAAIRSDSEIHMRVRSAIEQANESPSPDQGRLVEFLEQIERDLDSLAFKNSTISHLIPAGTGTAARLILSGTGFGSAGRILARWPAARFRSRADAAASGAALVRSLIFSQ